MLKRNNRKLDYGRWLKDYRASNNISMNQSSTQSVAEGFYSANSYFLLPWHGDILLLCWYLGGMEVYQHANRGESWSCRCEFLHTYIFLIKYLVH